MEKKNVKRKTKQKSNFNNKESRKVSLYFISERQKKKISLWKAK